MSYCLLHPHYWGQNHINLFLLLLSLQNIMALVVTFCFELKCSHVIIFTLLAVVIKVFSFTLSTFCLTHEWFYSVIIKWIGNGPCKNHFNYTLIRQLLFEFIHYFIYYFQYNLSRYGHVLILKMEFWSNLTLYRRGALPSLTTAIWLVRFRLFLALFKSSTLPYWTSTNSP